MVNGENITNLTNITNETIITFPAPIENLTVGGATIFVILWFIELAIFEKNIWKNKILFSLLMILNITIGILSAVSLYIAQYIASDPILWIILGSLLAFTFWILKQIIRESMRR